MMDVDKLRIVVFGSFKFGFVEIIGERFKDVEVDVDIIIEFYGFDDLFFSFRDEILEDLNILYYMFKKEFDDFECIVIWKK